MYRLYAIASLGAIALCLTPVFAVLWSSWFAERHGCVLNEAGAHPCVVNGTDWGGTLGAAFVSGWFGLITLPLGAALLAALILVTLARAIRRARR